MKTVKKGRIESIRNRIKEFFTKHKPVTKQDWIRIIVLSIAIPVFIYSSSKLVMQIYTYVSEDRKNQQIIDLKPSESKNPFDEVESSDIFSNEATDKFPYQIILGKDSFLNDNGIIAEYQNLWDRNNDLVGWFYFPNTPRRDINYPLLQAQDNIYYLNYDFDKNRSYSGSIYMDYRNNANLENPLMIDKNYIITGHAMKDFSMFGSISSYWHNETTQKNARYIYVDLLNTKLQYEVFATYAAYPNENYKQINFNDDQEYLEYLNNILSKSTVDFGIDVGVDDKIVTLETCYLSDRRTIIVGRLIKQIIYEIPESEIEGDNGLISRIEESDPPAEKPSVTPVVLPTDIPSNVPFPTATPPAEDRVAAELVMKLIDNIIIPVTVESRKSIIGARTAYDKLTDFQKSLVENYEALTDAEKKLKVIDDKAAAKLVSDLIKNIPPVDDITLDDRDMIEETMVKYNKLSSARKKLVEGYEILTTAVERIDELEVEEVSGLIEEISLIEEIGIEHSEQILFAKLKYDELNEEQKAQISNIEILDNAVSKVMILDVNDLISGIPEINDLTLENKAQIFEIKEKYDALTEDEKLQIFEVDILNNAITKIFDLEVEEVDELIFNIPELETIDITHKEQIMTAKEKYDALNSDQKSKVVNIEKLDAAVDKIESLENPPEATPTLTTTPTPALTTTPTPDITPDPSPAITPQQSPSI